ncbi:MAG: hypothetical protein H7836_15400 [Magnetococcus sp. YQC-3]
MKKLIGIIVAALALASMSAQAAIPAAASEAMAGLTADTTTLLAWGWGFFTLLFVGLVLFKIVKKVIGKAA